MTWKQMKRAWRRAEKNRMMTFQQLAGLAGGLACCILISLWVADERQVDRFGPNDDRLFQVLENNPGDKEIQTSEQTPGLLAGNLAADIPEIERSVSVEPVSSLDRQAILTLGDIEIYADLQYAGKDFFNLFSYPLIDGKADQVLAGRSNIVLSKSLALKLFHRTDGLTGRTISCNQQDTTTLFTISGIFDNMSNVSSTPFDAVLPYEIFLDKNPTLSDWRTGNPQTFVLLKPGASVPAINRKLESYLKQKNPAIQSSLFAQNYSSKYLHNHYENGKPSGGRIEYVTLFSVVAFVILFIACVNFINLATAFANDRMKERAGKETASPRRSLAWKLLGESMGMCTVVLLLALLLVWLSLPAFNTLTGKQLSLEPDAKMIIIVAGVSFITGLASGAYPAFCLSALLPIAAAELQLKESAPQQMPRTAGKSSSYNKNDYANGIRYEPNPERVLS